MWFLHHSHNKTAVVVRTLLSSSSLQHVSSSSLRWGRAAAATPATSSTTISLVRNSVRSSSSVSAAAAAEARQPYSYYYDWMKPTRTTTTAGVVVLCTAAAAASSAAWPSSTTTMMTTPNTTMMTTTSCEAASLSDNNSSNNNNNNKNNPLWPGGVDPKQVDALVDECMNDPGINIRGIPDSLERLLYKSTIQLTLNMVYYWLGSLHGKPILAHELQCHKQQSHPPQLSLVLSKEHTLSQVRNDLDEAVLEEMADRLLANKAINQTMIPDVLERQIYVNCLKIIFRLLDLLSATMSVSVCGHDFRLQIQPTNKKITTNQSNHKKKLSNTAVDTDLLLQFAVQQAGIDYDAATPAAATEKKEAQQQQGWMSKLFSQQQQQQQPSTISRQFVVQLHASLYGLILGILDDLLEHTQLELLHDRVLLDLVPMSPEKLLALQQQQQQALVLDKPLDNNNSNKKDSGYLPLASFTMGVGVGVTLMALLNVGSSSK